MIGSRTVNLSAMSNKYANEDNKTNLKPEQCGGVVAVPVAFGVSYPASGALLAKSLEPPTSHQIVLC